jgi:hypothetical protein
LNAYFSGGNTDMTNTSRLSTLITGCEWSIFQLCVNELIGTFYSVDIFYPTGHRLLLGDSSLSPRTTSISSEAMMNKWKSGAARILKCLSEYELIHLAF